MRRESNPSEPNALPRLKISRPEAERGIGSQVDKGRRLVECPIESDSELENAIQEYEEWDDHNGDLLSISFDTSEVAGAYNKLPNYPAELRAPGLSLEGCITAYRYGIRLRIRYLRSLKRRLPLYEELMSKAVPDQSPPSGEHLEKAIDRTGVPFISMSFEEGDQDINDYVKGILDALRIPYVTGERWSKDSIPKKVRARILESDFLISIFVKRGMIKDGDYTAPAWLVREATIAQEAGKSIVAWVEKGVADIAGLNLEKELIYFERQDVKSIQKATIKFLEALTEHLPGSVPGGVGSAHDADAPKDQITIDSIRQKVVRDQDGGLYYIDRSLSRHQLPDDATAQFFAGPEGEVLVSTNELERCALTEPIEMESVYDCEILYLDPGPHVYVLLSGRTKYVGIPDLTKWRRQQENQWGHVDEQEFRGYPSWD